MSAAERGERADKVPTQSRPARDVRQDQTKLSNAPNTANNVTTGNSDILAALETNLDKVMTLINSLCGREKKEEEVVMKKKLNNVSECISKAKEQ